MEHQFAHGPDLAAEGKISLSEKEQPAANVAAQRGGELVVDAELSPALLAVSQSALRQAVEDLRAARLHVRRFLQPG